MKRIIPAAAAVLVAVLALSALAGCGSEGEARKYIEEAREKGKKVAQYQEELKKKGNELLQYITTIPGITAETVATTKKLFDEFVALVGDANKAAQEANVDYEKILDLEGVDKYKEYARTQIEIFKLFDKRSNLIKDLAAIYYGVLEASLQGQPIDETAVKNAAQPIIEEREELTKEIDELNEKAVDLANELDLY